MSTSTGMAAFAISAKGDLVYAQGPVEEGQRRQLVWVDRKGNPRSLPVPARAYLHPRFSPDDRQVAVEIEGPAHDSFFLRHRAGGSDTVFL